MRKKGTVRKDQREYYTLGKVLDMCISCGEEIDPKRSSCSNCLTMRGLFKQRRKRRNHPATLSVKQLDDQQLSHNWVFLDTDQGWQGEIL